MRTLLRRERVRTARHQRAPRPSTFCLRLESLEDRRLLSAGYLQTNLVSDISGIARVTDPNLVNPWGLAYGPTSPFWVSDNGAGVSTLYNGQGQPQDPFHTGSPLVVTIAPPANSPPGTTATPTGVVFNGTTGFVVSGPNGSGPARFIFATEDGTISGWSPAADATHSILEVDHSDVPAGLGSVYKGLAMATDPAGHTNIYATNFRVGTVDVFDQNFQPVIHAGAFQDTTLPAGFAPFGIQTINNHLFVTYALQNSEKHDDVAGPGNGFIDEFTADGTLMRRFASMGPLNSPWGMAVAPGNFGRFSNDLLVGNFGDGRISAFNLKTGRFKGQLTDIFGNPIVIGGLWGLKFGNGATAGPTNTLFFSAGIGDESHGLFGSIQFVAVGLRGHDSDSDEAARHAGRDENPVSNAGPGISNTVLAELIAANQSHHGGTPLGALIRSLHPGVSGTQGLEQIVDHLFGRD